ncbi:uncharacterized protein LOC127858948 isoform X1 [Dreissena polymorpha]|uniref:uncharacterized protein LOC127858948 isoform X1 n=1 Tax=Dreissena polymorpha TaxID=45954 RepID=UPI00226428ED|nr:uncharacterized protein LOC127858948 isoform X1 [Dreissena polymorpha]
MRENPGKCIGKEVFAQKLTEAYLQFYKPITVINSFKSSGIYPVDSSVITSEMLKPALTFSGPESVADQHAATEDSQVSAEVTKAKGALEVFEETLSTPSRDRYRKRIQEGYNTVGQSPCFDVYQKIYHKANPTLETSTSTFEEQSSHLTGLDILAHAVVTVTTASVATSQPSQINEEKWTENSTVDMVISPVLTESLSFPKDTEAAKPMKQTMLNSLPDNLTSPECIRKMSLKQLEKVRSFAQKVQRAKLSFFKKKNTSTKPEKKRKQPEPNSEIGKRPIIKKLNTSHQKDKVPMDKNDNDSPNAFCKACHMTWEEDQELGLERVWVQCDKCDGWVHSECLSYSLEEDEPFFCPDCL